jgi:hypothetical protein
MLKDVNITYPFYSLLQKHQLPVPDYPGSPGKSPVRAGAQEIACIDPSKPIGYCMYHLLLHTKTLHSAHSAYDSHNKQRLLPEQH